MSVINTLPANNSFFSSITDGFKTGFSASGQIFGSALSQAIPIFTNELLDRQAPNPFTNRTLFNQNLSEAAIRNASLEGKAPLGFSASLDSKTLIILGVVAVVGVVIAVKL